MNTFQLELYFFIIFNKIRLGMFFKKLFSIGLLLILLSSCAQNTASLLGPAYTLGSSGNVLQAGLSYGSDQIVTKSTGKSIGQNLAGMLKEDKEERELRNLLKIRINQARKKLNLIN